MFVVCVSFAGFFLLDSFFCWLFTWFLDVCGVLHRIVF